jgi:gas vesicle protein
MSKQKSGGIWGGILIGGMVGAVTGLLLAPKSGRETRKLLRKSADALPELAEDLASSLQLQANRLSDQALQNWDGTLARLREAIAAGVDAGLQENQRLRQDSPPPPSGASEESWSSPPTQRGPEDHVSEGHAPDVHV